MRKEFNLKDYESGKFNVVTKDGRPVRILATDIKNLYPIVGAITDEDEEITRSWTSEGKWYRGSINSIVDLCLVSKTEKLYLIHYIDCRNGGRLKGIERYCVRRCLSKENADFFVTHTAKKHHFNVLRIDEIEVEKELLKD